jgi:hypothetical protein
MSALTAAATARPPCQNIPFAAEGYCRNEGACLDDWYAENQQLFTHLGLGVYSPGSSCTYVASEEIDSRGSYSLTSNTSLQVTLQVLEIFESAPDDPEVALNMCPTDMDTLLATNASARVVLGRMIRGQQWKGVAGVAFSYDPINAARQHVFLALSCLPDSFTEHLVITSEAREQWLLGLGGCYPLPPPCLASCPPGDPDCEDDTCCDSRWRDRSAQIYRDLTECVRDRLVPFSLPTILCAIGCCLLTTPFGCLMACGPVCGGAVGLTELTQVRACLDAANAADAANLADYCSCLAWKIQNCGQGYAEPEARDCP